MMDHAIEGVANHTFHVLNIFIRTGHERAQQTISTMDQCRISWGRVVEILHQTSNIANQKLGSQAIVEMKPLVYKNAELGLGLEEKRSVISIGVPLKKGDWVSVHWGYVCDILDVRQRRLLAYYTKLAIAHASHRL